MAKNNGDYENPNPDLVKQYTIGKTCYMVYKDGHYETYPEEEKFLALVTKPEELPHDIKGVPTGMLMRAAHELLDEGRSILKRES